MIGGVLGAVVDYGDFATNPVSFVNGIYAAGGEGYFDALSYHPYNYGTPFSQGAPLPESPLNQVTAIRNLMIANGDSDKLIWASEYGEPTAVATDAQQAAFLQDMLTTWPTLGYTGPTFVHSLQDIDTSSTDPEQTFGVIRSDGTLKPAAYVIAQLAAQRNATTPAMAQLALAMPGATEASPADLASLTQLAETPGAAEVTSADAAAVAQLATGPATAAEPAEAKDPAAVVTSNMNAMAAAAATQLAASSEIAAKALADSAQVAAKAFQQQVDSMVAATSAPDAPPTKTARVLNQELAATKPADTPAEDTPAAAVADTSTTPAAADASTAKAKNADAAKSTKAGPKHRRSDSADRPKTKSDAKASDTSTAKSSAEHSGEQKPRHAKPR